MVVTVSPEGVTATAVESNDEARILAKKTLKVLVEDDSETSDPVNRGRQISLLHPSRADILSVGINVRFVP